MHNSKYGQGQLLVMPSRIWNKIGNFFADNKRNIWLLYIAFALFNILLAVQYRAPFAYPDEYGVVTAGNWMLGGEPWKYKPFMYYGYTFSPFVGILIRLFHRICPVYIGSLCVKALQLSFIPVLAYKLLHEVLDARDSRVKIFLSAAVGLYPSLTVYAKYVSNETTLHVTLFVCLYLIGKLAMRPTKNMTRLYSALLGFFAVFAYASHGMGLAFIVAVCLIIAVAHICTKKKLVSYPFFFVMLVSCYLIDRKIKAIIMDAVYYVPSGGMANTFTYSFNKTLAMLLEPSAIKSFFDVLISRLLYISSSTFGLFLLTFIILLVFTFRFAHASFTGESESKDDTLFIVAAFSMVMFLCGIGLSVLNNMTTNEAVGRMFFYGRYFEYMALPPILIGLHRLFSRDVEKMVLLKYAFVSLACYIFLSMYSQFQIVPRAADAVNRFFILGIVPFLGNSASELVGATEQIIPLFDLFALALFAIGSLALMVWLLKGKHRIWALVVLSCMFLYGTAIDHFAVAKPLSVANYRLFYSELETVATALDEFKDVYREYPKLYLVTNRLGDSSTADSLIYGRAQMSFLDYGVNRVLTVADLNRISDPEEGFMNSIIVSDYEQVEYLDTNDAFLKVYESPGASIWIRGEGIRAYYDGRKS